MTLFFNRHQNRKLLCYFPVHKKCENRYSVSYVERQGILFRCESGSFYFEKKAPWEIRGLLC
ncbi:hypothetical protein BREVNS_1543 [Brevinematales bacterium NS]|nr:hypothetical protein BREVNS_1543 [Brevinematales bacterium NS]